MFNKGNLLYFEPFLFKNGALPKNKYMVVLGEDLEGQMILVSLPTSKDHIPSDSGFSVGCVDLPERQVNVFVFPANVPIAYTKDGSMFAFKVNTFVYGSDIDTYPVATFNMQISRCDTKVRVVGTLSESCFSSLLECLKGSRMVKNKYKRLL